MGCFVCDLCEFFGGVQYWDGSHVCDPIKLADNVKKLKKKASDAEEESGRVRNSVKMILSSLPSLDGETAIVDTNLLRELWSASECVYGEAKDADSFNTNWLAQQFVLCAAFDLFRNKKPYLENLTKLKELCVKACSVLGYNDENLVATPEDIIRNIKG